MEWEGRGKFAEGGPFLTATSTTQSNGGFFFLLKLVIFINLCGWVSGSMLLLSLFIGKQRVGIRTFYNIVAK